MALVVEEPGRSDDSGVQFVSNSTTPTIHKTPTSIQHWQLRDLISCGDCSTGYYYTNEAWVKHYNTLTHKPSTIMLCDFEPTSMTVGCGYVAAGGQQSQLKVVSLENDSTVGSVCYDAKIGDSVNNALNVTRHCGETRLLVSNNDETIKVFSLQTMDEVATIQCGVAINYSAVSPDGKHMVAVGDSDHTFLFDTNGYKLMSTLKETGDAGMCSAWNAASNQFAIASQEGKVIVWDLRMLRVLAKLEAKQTAPVKRACRSLRFSPSSAIDLLTFTEHVSYLHVVDARTYNDHQVIRTCPQESDISGVCFSADSNRIFVGVCDLGVAEYPVDTWRRRQFTAGMIR
eukprot:Rmarinus@m.18191